MLLFLTVVCGSSLAAERRVALVVGAGTYRTVPVLRNTLNDARAMAASLQRLDFEVDTVLDPDRAALDAAVRKFGASSRGADVALFFYAGHAVELGGRNWLIPVSADIQGSRELRFEATDLDAVLEQLDGAARLSVIVLDACRDNPFRGRIGAGRGLDAGGLARVQAPLGTLVAFSTAPGTVAADGTGANSPFTAALLKRIETPGLEIRQLLAEVRRDVRQATQGRQVTWDQSAMEGTLYLKAAASPAPAAPARAGLDVDPLFWDSVRNSANPADFRAYLARFPDGVFADLARNRLAAATALAAPAESGEAALIAKLTAGMSQVADPERGTTARAYAAEPGSKALALSPDLRHSWRQSNWPTPAIAEEKTLEGCQAYSGGPCVLLARNADVFAPLASGEWPRHDMPRVRYTGPYDPAQIPGLAESRRSGSVVMGYATAPPPKAMAYHPWGRVFAVTAAATQAAAETKALADCNADPERRGRDGPCYLYAAAQQVVLPQRLQQAASDPYAPIAAAVALAGSTGIGGYASVKDKKALVLHVESGRLFNWSGLETRAQADQLALEACQQQYAGPCVLVASGVDLVAPDPRSAPRRDMPRLHYKGPFKPDQVPFERPSPELTAYIAATEFKAIALRPNGARVRIVQGAASAFDAERNALAACNADNSPWPCFVYARGDQVVLTERRTEARQ